MDGFGRALFGSSKFTIWRPRFEFCICAYKESLSFLSRASLDIPTGDGSFFRLEDIVGSGLEGDESMAGGVVSKASGNFGSMCSSSILLMVTSN